MNGTIYKKLKLGLLTAVILGCAATNGVFASDDATLYEYDFEDYTGGAFATVDANGTNCWVSMDGTRYKMVQEENGNKGMDVVSGTPTMQYRLPEIMTDGVLYISYDFIIGSSGNSSYVMLTDDTEKAYNNQPHRKYVFYMNPKKVYGPDANLGNWGKADVFIAPEPGKKNNVQIIHDYTNKHHYTYVNGELLSDVSFSKINSEYTGTNNIRFVTDSSLDFIDNIRIAYMTDKSFCGRYKGAKAEDNSLLFEFSEGISKDTKLDSVYIKNMFTGEEALPTAVSVENQRFLRLTFSENISDGDEYELVLPENFENIRGSSPNGNIVFSKETKDGSAYLKSIRVIDCDENEHLLNEEITKPSKKILLTFSGQPDESTLGQISADWTDKYTTRITENTVLLNFDDYFTENQSFVISVPKGVNIDGGEIAKAYTLSFKTGAGVTEIRNFKFIKDGKEVLINDLSDGDTVTLNAEIIKTKHSAASAVLSYSKWNGRKMTGFNFKDISLGENETYSNGSMEIVVDSIKDFDLKGFIWLGINKTNPITDLIRIK